MSIPCVFRSVSDVINSRWDNSVVMKYSFVTFVRMLDSCFILCSSISFVCRYIIWW